MIWKEKRSELQIEKGQIPGEFFANVCRKWHQVCRGKVTVCENLQKGSTLPSRGDVWEVQCADWPASVYVSDVVLFCKTIYLPISGLHSSNQDAPLHVGLWGFSVQISF